MRLQTLKPVLTTARLSLGRPGSAVSTAEHLRFQLDHALARDAVHAPLDLRGLLDGLAARHLAAIVLRSNAATREAYLLRPDLGRALHPDSIAALKERAGAERQAEPTPGLRVGLVLADGLSALALERHALPLLDALVPGLAAAVPGLAATLCSPVALVQNARVAVGDPIGELLEAEVTVVLIGERPGLSSPDSLGCYITWHPRPGRTDAERNCISNVRGPEGLSYAEAAHRIAHYLREAHRLQTTGTALKDPALPVPIPPAISA